MWIWIRILPINVMPIHGDLDPDPDYHIGAAYYFDADADPDSTF